MDLQFKMFAPHYKMIVPSLTINNELLPKIYDNLSIS